MIHDRHDRIRTTLARTPKCSITALQKSLGVSRSTLRRDLLILEARGVLVRVHGGIVHPDYLAGEPTFDRRRADRSKVKAAIGRTAAGLVREGQAVYIDAGTTALEVGRHLVLRKDIKLFTHSIRMLTEAQRGEAEVIGIGGQVRRTSEALVGGLALTWLEHLSFSIAFLGASSLCPQQGACTTELTEAAIKQAVIARSREVVLVADATKSKQTAAVHFAAWDRFSAWVTDRMPQTKQKAYPRVLLPEG